MRPKPRFRPATVSGFSLPFVLGISAMLAFSSMAMLTAVSSASKTGGDMLRRRKAFYACDGLSRVVTKLSQTYMATTTEPTSEGLQAYICEQSGGCPAMASVVPSGFEVTTFEAVTVGETQNAAPIPSGPFRGMNARQDTIALRIRAQSLVGGHVCNAEQTVTLGKVALFQFYVFSDTYFDGHPGPLMTLNGRAHINGDACPGGNMSMARITASGSLRHLGNSHCELQGSAGPTKIMTTSGSYVQLTTANDHDSTGWKDNALAVWGGNALDKAHDVPVLKPPTIGIPRAQKGAHARDAKTEEGGTQTASVSNTGSLRFLVDPVLSNDSQDTKDQKLAYKADIRIIDGTWYVNDSNSWPGTPVWSDHPGRAQQSNTSLGMGVTTVQGVQIGQAKLANDRGWGATVPSRYSYYGTNATGGTAALRAQLIAGRAQYNPLAPLPPAVISYGTLQRQTNAGPFGAVYPSAGAGIWEPGTWLGSELCERTYSATGALQSGVGPTLAGSGLMTPANWNTGAAFVGYRDTALCSAGTVATGTATLATGTLLLNGTRSGFRENHRGGPYSGMADTGHRSQILPANFDVMAFQAAMQDTSTGELGSYFGGGVDFNGIVWITYTWPGALDGMNGSTFPDVDPADAQGTSTGVVSNSAGIEARIATDFPVTGSPTPGNYIAAGSQPVPPVRVSSTSGSTSVQNNRAAGQRELPFPLCTFDDTVARRSFLSGIELPSSTVVSRGDFIVSPCSNYASGKGGRINAVRIINGRNVNPEVFPKGLSIVTNLPVFVVGDMNLDSTPSDGAVIPQPEGARTWLPMLIGGDVMYHVSNNWDDAWSPWSVRTHCGYRPATATTFNIAELIGWVPSNDGIGGTRFHNLQGYQENWSGVNHFINGAVTIGWHAVYFRNNRTSGGQWAYSPPYRRWTFDENFQLFSNQPPGTPTFDVAATKKFKRDNISD